MIRIALCDDDKGVGSMVSDQYTPLWGAYSQLKTKSTCKKNELDIQLTSELFVT